MMTFVKNYLEFRPDCPDRSMPAINRNKVANLHADNRKIIQIVSDVNKKIKFLSLDVDRVLTGECMYVSEKGGIIRKFNVKEGVELSACPDNAMAKVRFSIKLFSMKKAVKDAL